MHCAYLGAGTASVKAVPDPDPVSASTGKIIPGRAGLGKDSRRVC